VRWGSEEVRIFWSCDARGDLSCLSSAKASVCTVNGDDAVVLSVNARHHSYVIVTLELRY
jgi:hypothetical protein